MRIIQLKVNIEIIKGLRISTWRCPRGMEQMEIPSSLDTNYD